MPCSMSVSDHGGAGSRLTAWPPAFLLAAASSHYASSGAQIEMAALASGNELLHGEAVNIDMALTTEVRLEELCLHAHMYKGSASTSSARATWWWHTPLMPACAAADFLQPGADQPGAA